MNEYKSVLKKVGIVLIIVGLIDIALMVYSIANGTSYSSSFNIFAVIAGILLYRGGLKAAKVVSFFSAFFLSAMCGLLVVFPLFIPLDLLFTYLRLNPIHFASSALLGIVVIIFLAWVLKSLTSPIIFDAMDQKGIDRKSFISRPRSGFICGILLLIILAVAIPLLLKGEAADMAIIEAQREVGSGYNFVVSSINIHSTV